MLNKIHRNARMMYELVVEVETSIQEKLSLR